MKSMLLLVFVVVGGSAFADLIPFEVIRPMPLHRIGIDILAEVVGAFAVGGLAIKQLLSKFEKMKKSDVLEIEKGRGALLAGGSTIAAGGEFVRKEVPEGLRENAPSEVPQVSSWRELGSDERLALESKLDKEMHVFESAYDKESGAWLREADLPSQGSAKRDEWWSQKCKELVFSVILQDDELRRRLKGVPIEWILSRMDRPTKRTRTEWVLWQMGRLFDELGKFPIDVADFLTEVFSSEFRRCMKGYRESKSFIYHMKIREARKKVRRWMCRALLLVYLVGLTVMALGVVGVEAPCATASVIKAVFYPFLPVIGVFAILFVFWVMWKIVLPPLNRWYLAAKLKRICKSRDKFFSGYRGERRWRIPVSGLTSFRQQMQMLPKDVVVGIIGNARDASLRLKYPGVARHHVEIYFDKAYHALGGDGFAMRSLSRSWIGEYVEGQLPKKETTVYLNAGRMICVGPYAILKVVSVPSEKDNAFVFELVDGKTIYAAPTHEELDHDVDDTRVFEMPNQIGEFLNCQRRKQRLAQMCSYLLKGLVIMAALLVLSGAFVGLFWWGESCVRDILPGLKESWVVRVLALFPWLFALVWSEMKSNRLPNLLTVGCLLSGIGVSAFEDGVTMLSAIGAAVVSAAVLLPFFLSRAVCAGTVKMFAAAMAFWGIQFIPFAFASLLFMGLPVCFVGNIWRRCFVKLEERHVPSSPIVLLSMLSLAVALWLWNGHGMLGGYIFMAGTLVLAAVVWLLFRERKQHADGGLTPASTCAAETAMPHADFNVDDARTVTTTGSELHGLPDATCRDSDDLVSETEDGTDDPSAFLNLHGHATIHGFRLDPSPLVAEGGQGRVFKAECVVEGRLGLRKGTVVALKFVEETDRSPSFEEFRKAVTCLREIESPHVPRYYGCFRVGRWVSGKLKRFRMTVMEYLDGADLGYRVKVRSPNFYADEIMYVLDQLLEGLCELSAAGIVHRDIKPSNVFICRDGTVKLIDFDTALIRSIDLCPKNRKIVGTPEFAAPDYLMEGFRGDEISDVFSVGMTLYYMVHGVSPHRAIGTLDGRMDENIFRAFWFKRHEGSGSQGWWKWNKNDGYGSPSHAPLLGLQQLLDRCLTADRNRRYGGLKEFRLSLQKIAFRTIQYRGQLLRVVSGIMSIAGPGPCFFYGEGRAANGELHIIPLEVLHKTGVWSLETGAWRRMCSMMRRVFRKTEMFDSNSLAEMRKSFDRIKSLEEWRKEIEEENEREMYS